MKPLNYLLMIFVAPPLVALVLVLLFMIVPWPGDQRADPRPTGTIGVRKGDRIGSPGDRFAPARSGGDVQ
jgi:hypothetical protein